MWGAGELGVTSQHNFWSSSRSTAPRAAAGLLEIQMCTVYFYMHQGSNHPAVKKVQHRVKTCSGGAISCMTVAKAYVMMLLFECM
jgi:hypothetical protein